MLLQYVLSLTGAAVVCGLLSRLGKDGPGGVVLRMCCGILLSSVAFSPLRSLSLPELSQLLPVSAAEARQQASAGEEMADLCRARIIKDRAEAYIQDKAGELGLSLSAEVVLSGENLPLEVRILGTAEPELQARLSDMIWEELGIAKEKQTWIG